MRRNRIISVFAATVFFAFSSAAQNESYNAYTPYSMYGIGEISKQGTTFNKSMGGIGIATRDKRMLNYLNPAAVTEREKQSFMADFGLASGNRIYYQDQIKSANNTFSIYDFVISFPVYKSLAMYGGLTPFSDIGYSITSYETDPSIVGNTGSITDVAEGYGGLSNLFLGAGVKVFKGMSVGAEVEYVFGGLHKNTTKLFSKSDFSSIYSGYNIHLNTLVPKVGVQYETPLFSNVTATVGATYRLATSMRGTVRDFEYNVVGSVTDTTRIIIDTLQNSSRKAKYGDELGIGIALKGGDKWTAEVNYIRSDWTSCGMDDTGFGVSGNAVFSATTAQSLRAGFSITPNRNDIRYYRRRITYRGGAYWDQAYYKLDGNTINTIGLTFGVTLPVNKWYNGLSLGMDVGQKGSLKGNNIRERFINFNIGINIFDIWFMKYKYD